MKTNVKPLIAYALSLVLSVPMVVEASKCNFNFGVQDVDVNYPQGQDPVPPSCAPGATCITAQEVFDATNIVHYTAAAEPSIAVNPKNPCNIVVAWQDSRISVGGGALEVGIAYSFDKGKSWKNSVVPSQICIGGIAQRATDVWLSYAADGSQVYLNWYFFNSTLVPNTTIQSGIAVSISKDGGATWSSPAIIEPSGFYVNEPTGLLPNSDKNSITANPNNSNFAYTVWDQFATFLTLHSSTMISRTLDKGLTWSLPSLVYNPAGDLGSLSNGDPEQNGTISNIVTVLPQCKGGDLLNFMVRYYATPNATDPSDFENDSFPYQFTTTDIAFVRSKDNGVTWDTKATIVAANPAQVNAVVFTGGYTYSGNTITGGVGTVMRTANSVNGSISGGNIIMTSVNPCNGNLYVVWQSGQFRADQLSQIALATSQDGGFTWSPAAKVSRTPENSPNPQAFTPAVAVTKDGFVGVIYSDFRFDPAAGLKKVPNNDATLSDTWLAIYKEVKGIGNTGIGLDFVKELRLSTQSYIAQNGPTTSGGVMTNGDYPFIVANHNNFFGTYTKSFNGPFSDPSVCLDDSENNAIVLLDNNHRQDPFVSIVDNK